MLPFVLLFSAGALFASPILVAPVFVINSPLTLSYEVIDPAAGGVIYILDGPMGPQSYRAGGYLLLPPNAAIIGDTAAFGITSSYGALLGLFLIHYNDGYACASMLCNLYPDHADHVTHAIVPDSLPDGSGGTFGPSQMYPLAWQDGRFTVGAAGFMNGYTTITYTLPYRAVVPEPATAFLTALGLALSLRLCQAFNNPNNRKGSHAPRFCRIPVCFRPGRHVERAGQQE